MSEQRHPPDRARASRAEQRGESRQQIKRRRRFALGGLVLLAGTAGIVLAHTSSRTSPSATVNVLPPTKPTPQLGPAHFDIRRVGELPSPLQDIAAVALMNGHVVVLGGLDGSDISTAAVSVLAGGHIVTQTRLPQAQHDAQGSALGADAYVFGGGQVNSYNHILRFDPASGLVSQAGQMPQPASDVAVARIAGTAYVVGGYNGQHALDTILAWRPDQPARVVGHLPAGLRYSAVAAIGDKLVIVGGSVDEAASRSILRFDPSTRRVRKIGKLPEPLTHASAVALGSYVYVIGGRRSAPNGQTSAILAISPSDGQAVRVGNLPLALSDEAVVVSGGHLLLVGGQSSLVTQSAIYQLLPK